MIEYVELRIRDPVYVESINVYETYAPGRLVKIQLLDPSGAWDTVWEGVAADQSTFSAARIFSPPLARRQYLTQDIRLEVDNIDSTDWYEIDAVEVMSWNCAYTANVYSENSLQNMHVRRNFASSILVGGSADLYEIRAGEVYMIDELNLALNVSAASCPLLGEPCSKERGTFAVTAVDPAAAAALFVMMPSLAPDGSLIFSLLDDTHGMASFTVTFTDDGGLFR